MAHSVAATARATTALSTSSNSDAKRIGRFPCSTTPAVYFRVTASRQAQNAAAASSHSHDDKILTRRSLSLGLLGGALVGLNGGEQSAIAAGRRPQPQSQSPPEERKDPNVSGLQAKVLASKRRKEAMKEEIAKLRQKGKTIQPPTPPSSDEPPPPSD